MVSRVSEDGATALLVTGGGLDTRLTRRISWRVQDDFQWMNFALVKSLTDPAPYDIPGLPNYFSEGHTAVQETKDGGAKVERYPTQ